MSIEFKCEKCNTRFKREYDYSGETAPCMFCRHTTLYWRTIESFQNSLHCTTCNPPHNPDFNKTLWHTVTIPACCSECGGDKFHKFVG
jgi:hypothetical protein